MSALGHGLSGAMNERQAAYFGRVNYSLRMTLEMLASILDVARIESGRFPLEYTRCDVNDVVSRKALAHLPRQILEVGTGHHCPGLIQNRIRA